MIKKAMLKLMKNIDSLFFSFYFLILYIPTAPYTPWTRQFGKKGEKERINVFGIPP
jgi:hypothetical protein